MKVLIIRFSSIGDIVLTSPVLRCLKLQKQAEVHFLTKKTYESILLTNPYVDKVYTINKDIKEVIPALKKESYDLVVDLHRNLRSWQVRLLLFRKSVAFRKLNLQKWWMVRFKVNCLPAQHIVDRYLEPLQSIGIKNDFQGLDYFIPEQEYKEAEQFLSRNNTNYYIAFVMGAAHSTKRLPPEKIYKMCEWMPLPVILLGGKAEQAAGEKIAGQLPDKVLNACGNLSLHQSAGILKNAMVVITHDTGLMHIAAAFHKKIISIWGNTVPEFGMYPYEPGAIRQNIQIEVKGLSCRPCSKIGFDKCPQGHFKCMQSIDEKIVWKAVEKLLREETD